MGKYKEIAKNGLKIPRSLRLCGFNSRPRHHNIIEILRKEFDLLRWEFLSLCPHLCPFVPEDRLLASARQALNLFLILYIIAFKD